MTTLPQPRHATPDTGDAGDAATPLDKTDMGPEDGPRQKEDRHFVTALARGLDVLAAFRSFDLALGNAELSQRCVLPKSTVSRLTHTLMELGYLRLDPEHGKYRLGSSALALAPVAQQGAGVLEAARPYMRELAELSQGVASLIIRDRGRMLILENCQSESYLTLRVSVGTRISGLNTAAGRAYLMALWGEDHRQALAAFRAADNLPATRAEAILARTRADLAGHGCATSFGEWLPDINSIAAAFRPGPALPPMTLSCSGPNAIVPPAHLLENVRPHLIGSIRRIEKTLGA